MTALTNSPIEISYEANGIKVLFPVETETLGVQFIPVQDESQRTTAYVNVLIHVRAVLGADNQAIGATTDDTMDGIKQVLTTQGGILIYKRVGCGDISVNVNGSDVKDIKFGPVPKLLLYKPLGQMACEIEWQVSTCVPFCGPHAKHSLAPYELTYSVSTERDRSGYTRRVLSGHISIALNRLRPDTNRFTDSADNYLERFHPTLERGFRRGPTRATLSPDRSRIDFEVVDEEVGPNYLPEGVIDAKVAHTLTLEGSLFSVKWSGQIRGQYEFPRNISREAGLGHIFREIERVKDAARGKSYKPLVGPNSNVFTFVRSLEMSDPDQYGKNVAVFTVNYLLTTSINNILGTSSIFKPVPGSDWRRWSASLADTAFHPRGNANLKFDTNSEVILSLCEPRERQLRQGGNLRPQGGAQLRAGQLVNAAPPPDASWVHYECSLLFESHDNAVVMKTLPTEEVQQVAAYGLSTSAGASPPSSDPLASLNGVPGNRIGSIASYTGGGSGGTLVQTRGRPIFYVELRGSARRLGYLIEPPWLISVAGSPVVPVNGPGYGFVQKQLGSWFGLNDYIAAWKFRFVCGSDDPRGRVQVMGTPFVSA